MKKIGILILVLFVIFPLVSAINLNVTKISEKETIIFGLKDPAIFKLNVTNNGPTDGFSFYTFFGLGIEPRESIRIQKGESKEVILKIFPREDSNLKGYVSFSYFIQAKDKTEIEKKLIVNIIDLKNAFEIGSDSINPESNSLNLYILNKRNFDFKDLKVSFDSAFFNFEDVFSLDSNQRKNFKVKLENEDFNKLLAGFYTMKADLKVGNVSAEVEQKINFLERDILKEEETNYGLVILSTVIKKTNQGNVRSDSRTVVKKSILSRMFTSFNPLPTIVKRDGFYVYYTWDKKLNPGELSEITITTNWLIPFILILLIVLTVILVKKSSQEDLNLRKRVSFVKANGGEFALKVMISIEAKNFVENIKLIDKLPPLVKVYGRFGGETPKRFNKTKKTFEWDLGNMDAGEKRLLSYIIYSRVGVLGRFALPVASALFEREGKVKEVSSNRAYFLAEQKN